MIHNPLDVSIHVTPRLSALIESVVNNPDGPDEPTLDTVHRHFAELLSGGFDDMEHTPRFDLSDSLEDELACLIEEYGPDARAVDFMRSQASEGLTCVIEAVVNDENRENPPTLGEIRVLLASGLGARLVGEGVLDEDEDDTLLDELDSLIEHFTEDALAEDFLRYE